MASSKAGLHQKDDGGLLVFDQLANGDEMEVGLAENALGGLDLNAAVLLKALLNLGDLTDDDMALFNLISGATSRVPILTDPVPFHDVGVDGGKVTLQGVYDLINSLTAGTPILSSPIAGYLASAAGARRFTPNQILDLVSSLGDVSALNFATDHLLIDQSGTARKYDSDDYIANYMQAKARSNDQTYTNQTAMQTDDTLIFNLLAGGVYAIEYLLGVTSSANPDFKFDFDGGTAGISSCLGHYQANASGVSPVQGAVTNHTNDIQLIVATWTEMQLRIGLRVVASSAGTFIIRHSQNTSNLATTGLRAGSIAFCNTVR